MGASIAPPSKATGVASTALVRGRHHSSLTVPDGSLGNDMVLIGGQVPLALLVAVLAGSAPGTQLGAWVSHRVTEANLGGLPDSIPARRLHLGGPHD